MSNTAEIARAMATTMENAAIPMYGKKLCLPDRSAIIALLKELRRLFFPAYFGDPQLMALPAENYAALLLERIETGMTAQIALALPDGETAQAAQITESIMAELPRIQQMLLTDIEATFDGDPAAANKEEIIFAYPGLFAIFVYRIAHELYLRHVPMIPRIMSEYAHSRTGIDIHPGAQIGPWFFIDHGTGIVIGETTEIGDDCLIYHGVTLGGTGKDHGKRHPTLGNNVMVSAGAKVLGPFKVGDGARIAANAVVLSEIPPEATAVGVPARVVRIAGEKVDFASSVDQIHVTDPVQKELQALSSRLEWLENYIDEQHRMENR